MKEIFEDLREAFQEIIEKRLLSKNSDPTLGITAVRQELEGQEFIVQCASGTFHFRSSMNGIIWLFREKNKQLLRINMFSLYPDELGLPQLIEKPVQSRRAPFRFTSIPRVVEDVLGSVK